MIRNYNDFLTALMDAGFSLGGGNNEGIYSIISWDWNQSPSYDTPVRWHTGDKDTDPWEWRMRVLEERQDIAYAKLFFKKSGYITKEWYPCFLAVRRGGKSFDQEYGHGKISNDAKRIYDAIREEGTLPLHTIKQNAGFTREDKSAFDRGIVELQMKLYITMCGRKQKTSQKGEEYGWSSTVFCLTEELFGQEVFETAARITEQEAVEKITAQVLRLNPHAEQKKILKFIRG